MSNVEERLAAVYTGALFAFVEVTTCTRLFFLNLLLGGEVTASSNEVVFVRLPSVALAVIVYLPTGVAALAETVRFVEQLGRQLVGKYMVVAPAGNPDTENVILFAVPETNAAVIMLVTDPPCATPFAPSFVREKSKAGGGVLSTFTVTPPLAVVLLAASRARAVIMWEPSTTEVVFHEILYGAAVSSAPEFIPSTINWTPIIPTLSAALAVMEIVPATVAFDTGDVIEIVGAMVSCVVALDLLE